MNAAAHVAVRTPGKGRTPRGDVPAGKAPKNTIQYNAIPAAAARGGTIHLRPRLVVGERAHLVGRDELTHARELSDEQARQE